MFHSQKWNPHVIGREEFMYQQFLIMRRNFFNLSKITKTLKS